MNIRHITVSVTLSLLGVCAGLGQSRAPLRFDVASIKRNNTSDARIRDVTAQPGGRLVTVNASVRLLIGNAYQLRRFQILGGPSWIDSDGYDIEAKANIGDAVTARQTWEMLQSLLQDRFKLKVHFETRETPVYVLETAKNGLKLQSPKEGSCATPDPNTPGTGASSPGQGSRTPCGTAAVSIGRAGTRLVGGHISMKEFTGVLTAVLGRPVTDKTGFTGTFDVDLAFQADQATGRLLDLGAGQSPAPDPSVVTIFTAVPGRAWVKTELRKRSCRVSNYRFCGQTLGKLSSSGVHSQAQRHKECR